MRAEVKVGLVVALVLFAGGAIWWFSRGDSQQGSVPFNKSEVQRSSGTTRLAQDAVPEAVKPKRPARSPSLNTPKRPVPQPARRTALADRQRPSSTGGLSSGTKYQPRRPAVTATGGTAQRPVGSPTRPAVTAKPTATPSGKTTTTIAGRESPKPRPKEQQRPRITGSPPIARVAEPPKAQVPKPKPSLSGTAVKQDVKPPAVTPPKRRDQPSTARPTFGTPGRTYTIVAGDTLIDIAREEYGDEKLWVAIKAANPGLDERRLRVGTKIKLPGKAEARRLAGLDASGTKAAGSSRRSTSTGTGRVYVVGEGDTLIEIARNVLGKASRWREIYELNKDQLDSPDVIRPGMKLKLPEK